MNGSLKGRKCEQASPQNVWRRKDVDDAAIEYFWKLHNITGSLLEGLESAIHAMQNWDELLPERRQSTIESLQNLVLTSKKAYGNGPLQH
jgi:hypothetical protein